MSGMMSGLQENVIIDEKLRQYVISVPTISIKDFGEKAKEIFDGSAEVEGIVVLEHDSPAGIIMRNMFYQKMGTQYGYSLYMKRSVGILMDTGFMSADAEDGISKVSLQATARSFEKLYDYIVVYQNRKYLGVISIRLFLEELSKRNEAQISVLKEQQQKLLAAHQQELQLRKNLQYQAAAVRNLLDHAEQGFLWFGSDLVIKNEVSYKCLEIFGQNVGGDDFLELIHPHFGKERVGVFEAAFDSYFKNNSPVTDAVYLLLLPADCVIAEKNVHFQYKRIESGQQKAIMVVMNDITDKVALEKAMEDDRYKQRLLIKAFGCQPQIKRMIDEFRDLFSGGFRSFFENDKTFRENLDELFRAVHTYKGDFAQYGFDSAAEKLHVLEDRLSQLINSKEEIGLPELENLLTHIDTKEILDRDLRVISEFLGADYFDKSEVVPVPKSKLLALESKLSSQGDPGCQEVLGLIRSLLLRPVKSYLAQYEDYIEYLSGRVMKSMPIFLVEGDDLEVDGERFDPFFQSLVHVFRNSMDHGIEPDEERLEAGKNQRGLIHCVVSAGDDRCFTLRISDDGRGIDVDKLKDKALERGLGSAGDLEQMDDRQLCDLVFADHISTKDSLSSLSGRGVGMSAVRGACLKLGGKIEIESCPGQGTAFIITLPYTPA